MYQERSIAHHYHLHRVFLLHKDQLVLKDLEFPQKDKERYAHSAIRVLQQDTRMRPHLECSTWKPQGVRVLNLQVTRVNRI